MRTLKIVLGIMLLVTANIAGSVVFTDQGTIVKADMPDDEETLDNITVEQLRLVLIDVLITDFWANGPLSTTLSEIQTSIDDIEDGTEDFEKILNDILQNQTAILNNQTDMIEEFDLLSSRIDAAVISINENTSVLLFGTTNISNNMSLASHLESILNVSQMNLSISIDDVSLEGLNETSIMNSLKSIEDMIGYGENGSIYQDMGYVVSGLYDKDTRPILKTADGTSSFHVLSNFLVSAFNDTATNQQTLLQTTVDQSNATRNTVREESTGILKRISAEANNIIENVGGPWAFISAAILIFAMLYFFLWKKYLLPTYFPQLNELEGEYDNIEIRPTSESPPPAGAQGLKEMIPFHSKNRGPPPCYKDGQSYSLMENPRCAPCQYKNECAETKIFQGNQMVEEQKTQQQKTEPEPENTDDMEGW